jgi:hypothetical protein
MRLFARARCSYLRVCFCRHVPVFFASRWPQVARTSKPPRSQDQHNALIHSISNDTYTSHCSTAVAQNPLRRKHLHYSIIAKHYGGMRKHITNDRAFETPGVSCARCISSKMRCVPCASTQVHCLPLLLGCHHAPDIHPTASSFRATVGISRC